MRTYIVISNVFFMLTFIALSGCSVANNTPIPHNETLIPSITPSPTLTSTLQPTSTYPPLPTPEPTLNPEKALAVFDALQDENCKLPCYLGIIPGQTTFQDAQAILDKLGSSLVSEYKREKDDVSDYSYVLDMGDQAAGERAISHSISLITNYEIVQIVEINAATMVPQSSQTALATYRNYWQRYSANQIFLQLGQPDRLFVQPGVRSGEYGTTLVVVYDELNVEIALYGTQQEINLCPPNEARFLSLKMILSYPEATLSINEISDAVPLAERYPPIEEVIGISTIEFYDGVMADPTICFEVAQDD